ncbi:MAG TPA: hypothetical protein VIY54_03500 [Steroidobacteraceae bacterium]
MLGDHYGNGDGCTAGRQAGPALPPRRWRQLVVLLGSLCTFAAASAAPAESPQAQARQIALLQQRLQVVQAQLRQLTELNSALLQQQQQLQKQLAQQQLAQQQLMQQLQQLAQQSRLPAAPAGNAAASGAAANASALPEVNSALPTPSAAGAEQAGAPPWAPPAAAVSSAVTKQLPGARPGRFGAGAWDNVRLWGYGEIYYSRPTQDPQRTQADLARGVFGIGYRFDDRTEFNSEYEVEHAVASATDVGEFEIEQFYVDRELGEFAGLRAGLFLMPFGFLNEHHEPTNFYGVQRNFVETLIIPSTWREGGLSLHGDTASGLAWSGGVTTGVDLSKWNFAPQFPPYTTPLDLEDNDVAPLQATHQELALANARHLSEYASLNYFGVPGLDVGGAISSGKAVPVAGAPNDPRVTLWEGHVRWTPGKWDLSALYARGTISDVARDNLANPGSPNPIPALFYGYFAQVAYSLWQHGEYRLNPFARWEYYNLGAAFSGTVPVIPTGLVPLSAAPGDFGTWPQNHDRVVTVGANFYVTPHVVFKADYQWYELNSDFSRVDLGLGLNF